jgi:protein gp37
MGEITDIGWTEATWNPWYGCTKISPGCKFCYMYREMQRYGRDPYKVQRSKTTFNAPLKWKEPRMVFTCSWSDFFIESADAWRTEAWEIIRKTPHLTYQILTKRPELIAERLPADWGDGYPNVWLGVSVESQFYFDRIIYLQQIPARVRFLSLEPLLAALTPVPLHSIDWVIVGGESGSDRDCQLRWITDLVDQCRTSLVPIFVKQDSGPKSGMQGRIPDSYWVHEFPVAA